MVEKILAHISGRKIYPNMRFVQEHNKQYKVFIREQIQ